MYQLGWFSTGRERAARDLLAVVCNSIKRGEIKAEVTFAFCTREPGESAESDRFMELVESLHIPLIYFSYKGYRAGRSTPTSDDAGKLADWRLDYDREVMIRLQKFQPNLCVLAGYMLVTGAEMCRKYDMINLHPAAPGGPVGTWQEVIWELIRAKARDTGILMNLVTPKLDKGPVVSYCTFSIRGKPFDDYWQDITGRSVQEIKETEGTDNHLFKLIREHGVARELPLIVATIRAFSRGDVRITTDKKIVDAAGRPSSGYNLTEEIDRILKRTKSV